MVDKQISPTTAMVGEQTDKQTRSCTDYSTIIDKPQLANLAVYKWDKWCSVAKITRFNHPRGKEWILAMVDKYSKRTWVSLPIGIVQLAVKLGLRMFYYRNDTLRGMWSMPLDQVSQQGVKTFDGVKEYVISLSSMTPEPWREWEYANRTVWVDLREE